MTVGVRHDDLRRRNRAMVIAAVRRAGQPSRTEIAGITGLSHSTISAIASDLIGEGVLVESKYADTPSFRRGRPQVALGLNPDAACVVTIVLTLNLFTACVVDYAGQPVDEETFRLPTLTLGKAELTDAVVDGVRRLLARQERAARRPVRLTLAIQGITDSAASTLLWSPITPHRDIPFGPVLEAAFGIPCSVQNDCNMIALALKWRPSHVDEDNFIAVLLSNGIGMGLMLRGQLFTGTHSSGGEFGHMNHVPDGALCRCGRRGCIEAYAGNYAIWRAARGLGEEEQPVADIGEAEMQALADAARERDGPERRAFLKAGEAIGFGLGNIFALFDPAPVVIVGAGGSAFDILEEPIRGAISRTAGGQHSGAISFETKPDETPLIREGCALNALAFVDREIVAGGAVRALGGGREVA